MDEESNVPEEEQTNDTDALTQRERELEQRERKVAEREEEIAQQEVETIMRAYGEKKLTEAFLPVGLYNALRAGSEAELDVSLEIIHQCFSHERMDDDDFNSTAKCKYLTGLDVPFSKLMYIYDKYKHDPFKNVKTSMFKLPITEDIDATKAVMGLMGSEAEKAVKNRIKKRFNLFNRRR